MTGGGPAEIAGAPGARLVGRRILVTGAASGMGRATAELFAGEGARLALLDRDAAGLERTASTTGGVPLVADLTDEAAVDRAVEDACRELGGLDGIVNAAGIMPVEDLASTSLALWRLVLDVNLTGIFLVCRAALPKLREAGRGTIVNFASAAGLAPRGTAAIAYIASKGGVIAFTRTLAAEAAPRIRVNAICPGTVDTPMTRDYLRDADGRVRPEVLSAYALGRYAEPVEIARAVLFLTADESSFVTGAALAVDGGRSFH
jgi:NAD(P)-dependent dehydrogenase (short-subunit alcohol dehydrogenase family)